MYAITHAATALLLKRGFPGAALWPLLISVQAVELLWVIFVYTGIEHVTYTRDSVHLAFLPYSHSIATAFLLATICWVVLRRGGERSSLALAVAIGVVSHIVLDVIHHEPDIALLPLPSGPRFGLGLMLHPAADLIVELLYGLACWFILRGSLALLAAIVVFNLLDAPLMFPRPGMGASLAQHPAVLPTVILIQIIATWVAVW